MSARDSAMPVALALLLAAGTSAADDVPPDIAFLEYLGSWEGTDEDWVMIRRGIRSGNADDSKRSDPVPDGNESQEHTDEN